MAKTLVDEQTGEVTEPVEEIIDKNWYRRPANFQLGQFDKDIETIRGKSLTIPDQSYTVREILEKFTRGLPLDIEKEGNYDEIDEFTGEEFENAIDITDVEQQLVNINSKIEASKKRVSNAGTHEQKKTEDGNVPLESEA